MLETISESETKKSTLKGVTMKLSVTSGIAIIVVSYLILGVVLVGMTK